MKLVSLVYLYKLTSTLSIV